MRGGGLITLDSQPVRPVGQPYWIVIYVKDNQFPSPFQSTLTYTQTEIDKSSCCPVPKVYFYKHPHLLT